MQSTSDASPTSSRRESVWLDWQWYLVLLLALLVRGGIGYVEWENFSQDPDSYRLLADNIVRIHSFTLEDPAEPTAFRPPLYPLLLAITSISRNILPEEVFALHVALGVTDLREICVSDGARPKNSPRNLFSEFGACQGVLGPILG